MNESKTFSERIKIAILFMILALAFFSFAEWLKPLWRDANVSLGRRNPAIDVFPMMRASLYHCHLPYYPVSYFSQLLAGNPVDFSGTCSTLERYLSEVDHYFHFTPVLTLNMALW